MSESTAVVEETFSQHGIKKALSHHGIKGMRWGFRRPVGSDGLVEKSAEAAPSGATKAKSSADHDRATEAIAKANAKGKEALSNEELRAIKNRVEAEKALASLTDSQKSELQKKIEQMQQENTYAKLVAERKAANQGLARKMVSRLVEKGAESFVDQIGKQGGKDLADAVLVGLTGQKGSKSKGSKSESSKKPPSIPAQQKTSKKSKSSKKSKVANNSFKPRDYNEWVKNNSEPTKALPQKVFKITDL